MVVLVVEVPIIVVSDVGDDVGDESSLAAAAAAVVVVLVVIADDGDDDGCCSSLSPSSSLFVVVELVVGSVLPSPLLLVVFFFFFLSSSLSVPLLWLSSLWLWLSLWLLLSLSTPLLLLPSDDDGACPSLLLPSSFCFPSLELVGFCLESSLFSSATPSPSSLVFVSELFSDDDAVLLPVLLLLPVPLRPMSLAVSSFSVHGAYPATFCSVSQSTRLRKKSTKSLVMCLEDSREGGKKEPVHGRSYKLLLFELLLLLLRKSNPCSKSSICWRRCSRKVSAVVVSYGTWTSFLTDGHDCRTLWWFVNLEARRSIKESKGIGTGTLPLPLPLLLPLLLP